MSMNYNIKLIFLFILVKYTKMQTNYFGEHTCYKCDKTAYYLFNNNICCGWHSTKSERKNLKKNPKAKEYKIKLQKLRQDKINIEQELNKKNNIKGKVIISKLRMMRNPDFVDGVLNIYPNFKHQNRTDGFGCASLSPKSLGPVEHTMKNLPVCLNLENYHQGAKIWSFELAEPGEPSEELLELNKITLKQEFKEKRINMYKDKFPYRHKYDKKSLKKYGGKSKTPLYSLYYDKFGNIKTYQYIQCRYFYCYYYELLTRNNKDLQKLKRMIQDGTNINIVGYDGYMPDKDIYYHYCDEGRPFGHELCLYVLLIIDDPKNYPWNVYYEKHKEIYKDMF